ncbi:MAG: NAD(P)-dependent alcohol dehydrogenase [Cytophagales bacterium]|nr:NAD(P)-dependent alcohol dehydrogenase [Cytophagales bacterium]
MKSYIVTTYGNPEEVVHLQEVDQPKPEGKQVLVKVKAAPVNDYDWSASSGLPKSYRLLFGWSKPRKRFQRLGMEVAGIVEETGPEVTQFKVGDAVYGDTSDHEFGSFSEYMCVNEKALHIKPERMSFVDAVAIPHAAMLAYEALIDLGKLGKGQQVLINGAGGGMGTFGLQIAKTYDAEVTGVDGAHKFDMMRDHGFDHLIDYQQEDFTQNGKQYDLILDAKTNRSPGAYLKSLKPKGKYISVGGKSGKLLQLAFFGGVIKLFTGKLFKVLALEPNKYLDKMNEMYEAGAIKPVIDGPHSFDKVPYLIKYFGDGLHKGKIVITMEEDIL